MGAGAAQDGEGGASSPEKGVRGVAVRAGGVDTGANTGDLGFELDDARMEFVDRQRVEILGEKLVQWVLRPSRKQVVEVHNASKVDRGAREVNRMGPCCRTR